MFDDFYPEEPTSSQAEPYTVQALTQYIARLIGADEQLRYVSVRGEISNLTMARSGHWYFTLKDANAALSCAMFKSANQHQRFKPSEGDEVIVSGSIRVYAERGVYQLYAEQMVGVGGVGDLYRQFEALKQQLGAEGLFDVERKRPIPTMPRTIGVVTSANAAALRDIRHVIERRYPQVRLILSPTLVQGAAAPAEIVAALRRLYGLTPAPDVIIIARGGGSIEDLWSFNDEGVVRAIAESPVPTLSGVGHETDFTLTDFVVDERAPTPSAAAERATPDRTEMRLALLALRDDMARLMVEGIAERRQVVVYSRRTLGYQSPQQRIHNARQQSDEWLMRLGRAHSRYMGRLRERLEGRWEAVRAVSPQSILARGYAVVRRADDGRIVRQAGDAPPKTDITIQTQDALLQARITGDEEQDETRQRPLF